MNRLICDAIATAASVYSVALSYDYWTVHNAMEPVISLERAVREGENLGWTMVPEGDEP